MTVVEPKDGLFKMVTILKAISDVENKGNCIGTNKSYKQLLVKKKDIKAQIYMVRKEITIASTIYLEKNPLGLLSYLHHLGAAIFFTLIRRELFSLFTSYTSNKKDNIHVDISNELWKKPRHMAAKCLDLYGKIWHGYEVIGMEKLPEGPGLIIYYHGATPFDYAFFAAKLYVDTGRLVRSVIHYFFYLMPGIKLCLDIVGCTEGKQANCVQILKEGHLVAIAPGGLREENFSDENYNLEWGTRTGFAQVALKSKVPIIPMFTQNLREAYRTVGNTRLSKWLFEHFKLLVLPIYGGFPVKLRTYIGEPIPYDPNLTAKELAEKTKIAIENLRDRYQKRPGNILRALLERFDKSQKDA